jgi:hypothetical protein
MLLPSLFTFEFNGIYERVFRRKTQILSLTDYKTSPLFRFPEKKRVLLPSSFRNLNSIEMKRVGGGGEN